MEILNKKQYSFLGTHSSIRTLFLILTLFFVILTNCGVPSEADQSSPPFSVNRETDRTTFSLKNNDGLAFYYKFIKPGETVTQNFADITSNDTDKILKSKNYILSNDEEVYVWFKTTQVVDPIVIELEHASLGSNAKITVKDSSGKVLISNKILLRNSIKTAPNTDFTSPMKRYKDTGTSSGTTDMAWVAVSYKLNPITIHTTPSIPTFIGYMRGLLIN